MAVKKPRDPQDIGYLWPAVFAIAVHLLIVLFSLVEWPDSDAEPDSSSIVQATLISTEAFTNRAQQANDESAAMEGAEEAEGAERAEWGEVPQRTDRTDVAAIFILSYG